jgi:hypothetical protein
MSSANERTDPLQAVFNFASLIEESNEPAKIAEYAVQLYHFWKRLLELRSAKNQQRTLEEQVA